MNISSGEICNECPYRKDSAKGYLGGNNLAIYSEPINHEIKLPCHKTQGREEFYCSGLAAVRVNSYCVARDPIIKLSEAKIRVKPDQRSMVFSDKQEFINHHTNE